MKKITIYTDGACINNPGAGGWAAVLIYKQFKKEIFGGCESTTNNRMEITGLVEALERLTEPCEVDVFSDSRYVVDSMNLSRMDEWHTRGWKKKNNSPVPNSDLWIKLYDLSKIHNIKCHWVKGHSDNVLNNRCDELAESQARLYHMNKNNLHKM